MIFGLKRMVPDVHVTPRDSHVGTNQTHGGNVTQGNIFKESRLHFSSCGLHFLCIYKMYVLR